MRKNSDLSERELQEFRRWMFDETDGDRNEWVAEAHGPCD